MNQCIINIDEQKLNNLDYYINLFNWSVDAYVYYCIDYKYSTTSQTKKYMITINILSN